MKSRPVSVLLTIPTLLLLSSCVEPPEAFEEATGSIVMSPGSFFVNSESGDNFCKDFPRPEDSDNSLVGAYFSVAIDCAGEIPSLDLLPLADTLDFAPQWNIPDGNVINFVRFGDNSEHPSLLPNSPPSNLSATLTLGTKSWEFTDEVPTPGALYMWVGASGSDMNFEVNDNNHVFSIKPLTMERDGVIDALYNGTFTSKSSPRTSKDLEYSNAEWEGSVPLNFQANVQRSIFVPDQGWETPDGQAVLSINFVWYHHYIENDFSWNLNSDNAMVVSIGDTILEPEQVDAEELTAEGVEFTDYTYIYHVDGDQLNFDFAFTPPTEASWGGDDPVTLPAADSVKPVEFSLGFELDKENSRAESSKVSRYREYALGVRFI